MMRRLIRWLRSSWVCTRCGREFHMMCFGYGTCVCPDCYRGEQPLLFPDEAFLLNRLMARIVWRR